VGDTHWRALHGLVTMSGHMSGRVSDLCMYDVGRYFKLHLRHTTVMLHHSAFLFMVKFSLDSFLLHLYVCLILPISRSKTTKACHQCHRFAPYCGPKQGCLSRGSHTLIPYKMQTPRLRVDAFPLKHVFDCRTPRINEDCSRVASTGLRPARRCQWKLLCLCSNQREHLPRARCLFSHSSKNLLNLLTFPVSLSTPVSALTTVDAKVFRHEFITIFRLSEIKTFHPADISIMETIDDYHVRYEEENETVFVARELLDRIRKMSEKPRTSRTQIARHPTRGAPSRWW
jgi:hypothetical protein